MTLQEMFDEKARAEEAEYEEQNALVMGLADKLRVALAALPSNRCNPSTGYSLASAAATALDTIGELPDVQEYTDVFRGLDHVIVAQLLMEWASGEVGLSMNQKVFWLQVAAHMGPDYIHTLRTILAFMHKVEEFA